MSRFQLIGVPDPNNVPAAADVSLTQTRFVTPAKNTNLDALIQGLQFAVGIATEKEQEKVNARIKLQGEQLEAYNTKAKERLFAAEQKYNEANISYNEAIASGDEDAIAESKGFLLDAMKEVGFESSRIADDGNIDLAIRKGAEQFSTNMYNSHSDIVERQREAEEEEIRQAEIREINQAVQAEMVALSSPHVMDTIVRQEQATEGPPISPQDRFNAFVELTTERIGARITEATGIEGEELQEYLESDPMQKAILSQSLALNDSYLDRQYALAKEAEELQRADFLDSTVQSYSLRGTPVTIADIGAIQDATNASETEIKFELEQDLSARYGNGGVFDLFNKTEGWLAAIETADNLGLGSLKSELTNSFVGAINDIQKQSLGDFYVIRRRFQEMYPDIDNLPSYLSEVSRALQADVVTPVNFRTTVPAGDLTGVSPGLISDPDVRHAFSVARQAQLEYNVYASTNTAPTAGGSVARYIDEESGLLTPEGRDLRNTNVEAQASFFLMARRGLEGTVDTADTLRRSLLEAEGPEEWLAAIDIVNTSADMRASLFQNVTPQEAFTLRYILESEAKASSNPNVFSETLIKARRLSSFAYKDLKLNTELFKTVLKETPELFDEFGILSTETQSKLQYNYAKLRDNGIEPEQAFRDAFEIFKNEHWVVNGDWVPRPDFAIMPENENIAIENIRYNVMDKLYTTNNLIIKNSTVMGEHTQEVKRLDPEEIEGLVGRWLPVIENDYKYTSFVERVQGGLLNFNTPIKAYNTIRQPANLWSGSSVVVNGRVTPKLEIAKAVVADRITKDPYITQQILDRYEGDMPEGAMQQIQWTLANALLGETTTLKEAGITSTSGAYVSGADNKVFLQFQIMKAEDLKPLVITIPTELYEEISTRRLLPPPKETTTDSRNKEKTFDRFAP